MRIPVLALFSAMFGALFLSASQPVQAQSQAAMQVCADILAQYGIAPEGCDPEDEIYNEPEKKKTEVKATTTTVPKTDDPRAYAENNIFFRIGGDKLDSQAKQKLDRLSAVLNTTIMGSACIRLVGHSDVSGPANVNKQMGLKRATVVAQYLRPKLSDPSRIKEILSDGEENPILAYAPENAAQRRVTIYARTCPKP